jgi:hypothetical protein
LGSEFINLQRDSGRLPVPAAEGAKAGGSAEKPDDHAGDNHAGHNHE